MMENLQMISFYQAIILMHEFKFIQRAEFYDGHTDYAGVKNLGKLKIYTIFTLYI